MRSEPPADARPRLVGLIVLAFCFSSLHSPVALAAMVALTGLLVSIFGPAPAVLARRLRMPGLAVAALVALLPVTSGGTVIAAVGPVGVTQEGLAAAIAIGLRFLCIAALIVALVGMLPAHALIAAMRSLGLPAMLADMAMLVLRHIEDVRADLRRARNAMRLRGAPAGYWNGQFRSAGWMLAGLLLRSHARSERVYHAMILRGHGAAGAAPWSVSAARPRDWAVLPALAGAGAALVVLDALA